MMRVERLERMRVEGELAALHVADRSALPVQQPQHPRPRDRPRPGAGARLLRPAGRGLPLRAREPRPAARVAAGGARRSSPTTTPCSRCASARRSRSMVEPAGRGRRRLAHPAAGAADAARERGQAQPLRSGVAARHAPVAAATASVRFAHARGRAAAPGPAPASAWPTSTSAAACSPAAAWTSSAAGGEFAVDRAAAGRRMNLFLVEDEAPARERLIETIGRVEPAARIAGVAGSVQRGARLARRPSAAGPDAARRAARRRPLVRAVHAPAGRPARRSSPPPTTSSCSRPSRPTRSTTC